MDGILVKNSVDTVQIDSNYRNLFYNRTISYTTANLGTVLDSLASDEFPLYDINTVNASTGNLYIGKPFVTVPLINYGLTVYKTDGFVAYSSEGRPFTFMTNAVFVYNRFIDTSLPYTHVYLPVVRPGKTRCVMMAVVYAATDSTIYSPNVFSAKTLPNTNYYDTYFSSSISNGIQHITVGFEIAEASVLYVCFVDI